MHLHDCIPFLEKIALYKKATITLFLTIRNVKFGSHRINQRSFNILYNLIVLKLFFMFLINHLLLTHRIFEWKNFNHIITQTKPMFLNNFTSHRHCKLAWLDQNQTSSLPNNHRKLFTFLLHDRLAPNTPRQQNGNVI